MENLDLKTAKTKKWHSIKPTGHWQLMYKCTNSQGATAFGGKHLPAYPNPFTGEMTYLRDVDNTAKNGIILDQIIKDYYPDQNQNEFLLVSWLICHPEVIVKGVKHLDPEIQRKKKASQITLTAMDFVEIEDEDYIDRLIGIITLNAGRQALGLEKLRHVMAALKLTYYDSRYKGETEKKILRSKLKTFVRKSIDNAKLVDQAINDLDSSKEIYMFKEMLRFKVLTLDNSVYKFKGTPMGHSFEKVQEFWGNHPEVKTEAVEILYGYLTL